MARLSKPPFICLVAALCLCPTLAWAQWDIQHVPATPQSSASLEISYRSSGERLSIVCSHGIGLVSFSPGYRMLPSTLLVEGIYRVDAEPPRPLRWRISGNLALVAAPDTQRLLSDLTGATKVFFSFAGVEQTYDLTPLRQRSELIHEACNIE
ncbi:hypothetical protein E8L99_17510 [Phreatobacter aquaticus]|uniref:Uncharacterized protein n=1 Tax=Phreatobacter aquaticus TaxID=2570229 RepID=A0A4D7QR88_9HYPH|nr:hypothetical protein [Phreatobacter aquaticus]QCK87427.1 hypothetical protein E8L99_17510 [Phreatobacter aquaticus]